MTVKLLYGSHPVRIIITQLSAIREKTEGMKKAKESHVSSLGLLCVTQAETAGSNLLNL